MSYVIDEGHCLELEDAISLFSWKINDLRGQGLTNVEIMAFDDHELWKNLVKKIINHD